MLDDANASRARAAASRAKGDLPVLALIPSSSLSRARKTGSSGARAGGGAGAAAGAGSGAGSGSGSGSGRSGDRVVPRRPLGRRVVPVGLARRRVDVLLPRTRGRRLAVAVVVVVGAPVAGDQRVGRRLLFFSPHPAAAHLLVCLCELAEIPRAAARVIDRKSWCRPHWRSGALWRPDRCGLRWSAAPMECWRHQLS